MISKLCVVKNRDDPGILYSLFYPSSFVGGEIVLCVKENESFASIFFNHQIFTIMKDYLTLWG